MKEQFVTYEIALKLKELGFDEACLGYFVVSTKEFRHVENAMVGSKYTGSVNFLITAPLWQQAIDWLREKQNIFACSIFDQISGKGYWCTFGIMGKSCDSKWDFDTYEDAREYAILKALELCQEPLK